LLTAAGFGVTYLAFAVLALAQEAHWTGVTGSLEAPPQTRVRRWRQLAGAGLALACALCLLGNGPGFGVLLSVLMLGACAIAVAFTLTWQPRWLGGVAGMLGRLSRLP
jgi:hypothetical protein